MRLPLSLMLIVIPVLGCAHKVMARKTNSVPCSNDAVAAVNAPSQPVILSPIQGVRPNELRDSFNEMHNGHRHEAIDIMEPSGTPVRAVVSGTIRKLFLSKAGGITIYEFDANYVYCYYYAHLGRYADDLHEGMRVYQGEVVGYVGSTGNASPLAPHLHFAVNRLGPQKRWWCGAPIDPYPVLERSLSEGVSTSPASSARRIYLILEMLHAAA
jgi:murein DD-endopeptidase MepM/ murein hydrolase activator NlpD